MKSRCESLVSNEVLYVQEFHVKSLIPSDTRKALRHLDACARIAPATSSSPRLSLCCPWSIFCHHKKFLVRPDHGGNLPYTLFVGLTKDLTAASPKLGA